ncbi:MAG TPA: Rieske 2Fe-2S domain-containing protein [Acidimicrobiales bacterium]|nr:Rieske 2Fe-2S domain-containing protein [Acidimicrobiales bacterium]
MAPPNIPAAKRNGLPVDFDRLRAEGDAWLGPEDRYALKTWGVCTQDQAGVFMVRIRNPGGALPTPQARGVARISRAFGPDWLHLTTRQNIELHWVEARRVPALLHAVAEIGMTTRSGCGHTLRNVMCSEDAGSNLDEPFDCLPDARAVSDAVVARSAELNCVLPSRVNMAFGGSPRSRSDARLNDAGFVSVVRDGQAGYQLWAGGSLGRAPFLAVPVCDFVPRDDVVAAAEAVIDVFVAHGDLDRPARGRMKFVVERLGEAAFRAAWDQAFAAARERPRDPLPPVDVLPEADRVAILAHVPPGGWSAGVRPQRRPGAATLTVDVPLGDTNGSELELLSDLADRYGDGALNLSRDQNIVLRGVAVADVAAVRDALATRGLFLAGEARTAAVRACTGSAVCALGITTAPDAGRDLLASAGLGRNSGLRVHVSGCPNSCAQHQAGDIGLSGSKVRVGGTARAGYHVYLGADLAAGRVGEVVGRVAAEDVPATVEAVVGIWEALRHEGESLGAAVARLGHDAFARHLESVMAGRWASGAEPEAEDAGVVTVGLGRAGLAPGTVTAVDAGGTALALANTEGTVCAVADACPHAGASLATGTLRGSALECPRHGGTFDVRTGEALAGPTGEPVRCFPVSTTTDGRVAVTVPAPAAPSTGG